MEDARNAHRTLTEAQLRGLTLDQLLEMQEHVTNIIKVRASTWRRLACVWSLCRRD